MAINPDRISAAQAKISEDPHDVDSWLLLIKHCQCRYTWCVWRSGRTVVQEYRRGSRDLRGAGGYLPHLRPLLEGLHRAGAVTDHVQRQHVTSWASPLQGCNALGSQYPRDLKYPRGIKYPRGLIPPPPVVSLLVLINIQSRSISWSLGLARNKPH